MAQRHEPVAIRAVIPQVIESLSRRGPTAQDLLAEAWPQALGKQRAAHTRLVSLQQGVLTVLVDDAAWFFSLHAQERAILQKLRRLLGRRLPAGVDVAVERVQFRVGSFR
jgi:predicted nucleic acid-binding Zn ribbon protein